MTKISPPPEYMRPSPFDEEGQWSSKGERGRTKGYYPVPSKLDWKDKEKFVKAVLEMERFMWNKRVSPFRMVFRGILPSMLEKGVVLGISTFVDDDQDMRWRGAHVHHYIGKWNVMPTKRFYDYVMYRLQKPFRGIHRTPRIQPAGNRAKSTSTLGAVVELKKFGQR
jgi:hypothetical protein